MEESLQVGLLIVKTLYPIGLLILSTRAFTLWARRVRVTDWLGYAVFGSFLAAGLIQLWDTMGTWGILPAIIDVGAGLAWARRDQGILREHADGHDREILGFFLVSRNKVPAGVHNWFS